MAVDSATARNIQVIPTPDTLSLEDGDRVILRFSFTNPAFTPELFFEDAGEFIRDSTFVYIDDDDGTFT